MAELAAADLDGLDGVAVAEDAIRLRRLLDGLEGQWLRWVAAVDAQGAAGADQGQEVGSTAAWLRSRLRMSGSAARSAVRTARALFRGPLTESAAALTSGAISPAHARMIADGTQHLPEHVKLEADPVLAEAASRLDLPRLRQAVVHLVQVVDPDGADRQAECRHERRGLWLSPTWEGMVAVDGLLEPEAGQTLLAALEPLARPATADDRRTGGQRTADALTELARRALEGGRLPQAGGVRPQLLVTVDVDSLLGPGGLGGEVGWAGPLSPEACRRLACDATVTRVLVTRHPGHGHGDHDPYQEPAGATLDLREAAVPSRVLGEDEDGVAAAGRAGAAGMAVRLRAAAAQLPPVLGGAPSQPLDVGRATRVIQPAQRAALTVRDGGCVFPGCDRPLAWCEAHHLQHWLHGGPTNLANLALLCRAHHRAVHEGGWRLIRGPDGQFTATPPHRRRRSAA
ncbi:MAG TPA: DUF222 domain-containing protein [Actinomycetota bacterium]|nr:DUF222 domain-containing protein [Actinomycetota bacterium]